ncbi:hypothetical protein ES703_41713 [subsurface metagenome]
MAGGEGEGGESYLAHGHGSAGEDLVLLVPVMPVNYYLDRAGNRFIEDIVGVNVDLKLLARLHHVAGGFQVNQHCGGGHER